MKITLTQTRDIYKFGPIIQPLTQEFGLPFVETLMIWCQVTPDFEDSTDRTLWEVWMIKYHNKPVGICGLYSLVESREELWLGWFGIIPQLRGKGIGKDVMKHLYNKANKFGGKYIMSYVDKEGKPLSFYRREGFKVIGTVGEYLKKNKQVDIDDFEDRRDFIIRKKL